MFKITLIAALLVSSVAVAQEQTTNSDRDATKREQRIKDLNKIPASVFNICRGC